MRTMNPDFSIRSALSGFALIGVLACGMLIGCGPNGGGDPVGIDEPADDEPLEDEPDGDEAGEDPGFDLTGTWRLYYRGFSVRRWWAFDLTDQQGARITGETRFGREFVAIGSVTQFFDARPVELAIDGDAVVLSFDMDDQEGAETLTGELISADRIGDGGGTWKAERITIPAAPTDLQAAALSTREVELTWTDESMNEHFFQVDVRCCGEDFVRDAGRVAEDNEQGVVGGLEPGTSYDFQLRAGWSDRWEGLDWTFRSEEGEIASATTLTGISADVLTPSAGPVGATVEIRGFGLSDPQDIQVGGVSALPFVAEESTDSRLIVLMPNTGSAGEHPVSVVTSQGVSEPLSWTQQGDGDPSDPANDDPATAPAVSFPLDLIGSFAAGDTYDLYAFTLESETPLHILLDWNSAKDLDVLVTDPALQTAQCGRQGAGVRKPEEISCWMYPGEYRLLIRDFDAEDNGDASLVSYRLRASLR